MLTPLGRVPVLLVLLLVLVGLSAGAGLSVGSESGQADRPQLTAQNGVDCGACHDDPTKLSFPNEAVCTGCHVTIGRTYQGSIHSTATDTYANFDCTECHTAPEDGWFMHFGAGPHGSERPGISMAPEGTCAQSGCHDSFSPRGAIYAEWNESSEGAAASHSHSSPAPSYARTKECSPCHGTHEGVFENIEEAPGIGAFAREDQPDPVTVDEWRTTCVACHDPHDVRHDDNLRGSFESESRLCGQCHTDPGLGSHSEEADPHPSVWELYSGSAFASPDGTHPQLECSSCHMASQADTEDYDAWTGHTFEVNTTLLSNPDRLVASESAQCGTCHRDLAGTIDQRQDDIQADLALATRLREEANQSLSNEADEDLREAVEEGTFWVTLVESPTVGIHNPALASERLRESIETFERVKSRAASQDGNGDRTPTTTTTGGTPTTTTTQPTTGTETPSLGLVSSLAVLVGALLLARWRRT